MPFEYIGVEDAIARDGLRMVVVGGLPSPWGEAAKGIFHIKKLEWAAVRLDYEDDKLKDWAGRRSGPVAVYDQEPPRHSWNDILMLAERLAPEPALLPADPGERAWCMGLSHEICGEGGLGWSRRLQLIHLGLEGKGGFAEPVAKYLARKYGYGADTAEEAMRRTADVLALLTDRLDDQEKRGSRFYFGDELSAVDVYSATFMALFDPLPQDQCPMAPATREAFETMVDDGVTPDPVLLRHRDMMYREHLELPLSL